LHTSVVSRTSFTTAGIADKGGGAVLRKRFPLMSDSQLTAIARLADRLTTLKERL